MPSRLTVVLVSLLLATPAVIFWIWLLIQPTMEAKLCPEECRCGREGYFVNCSGSGLNSIPSILPKYVRVFVFEKNNLTFFENESFVSRGLVELNIIKAEYCKIRKIELRAFNGLTKLTHLSMKGNEISEIIPGTFEKISSLEYLDLSYNRFEHLESDVFGGLVNLKYINLGGNKLQYLHPDTFVGLSNLQSLFLSKNPGLQIPTDRHFINSHSLKELGMSFCNVRSVSVQTFANVSALELLDLSYNNLRSVDVNILKALPKLAELYLYGNPLQCDCQLQEVWRWCQDHNIQTAYKDTAPECDTPSEVKGIWWGVLEKVQCLQDNIYYYGDYKNKRYIYTHIEDFDRDPKKDGDTITDKNTETKQGGNISRFFNQYRLPTAAAFFLFGTTCNIILIITITCNKDMRTLPNMYILNVAASDIIYLTVLFWDAWPFSDSWLRGDFMCTAIPFCYRMSIGLTAYSIAVLSIHRYRVTVNPLEFHASSRQTWLATGATICGVWIVAVLFAIPSARSRFYCWDTILLWHLTYYQRVAIFQLTVSFVLPVCVISFSYIMTARHLVESSSSFSEETQNPQLNTRKNTAKVLLALTVVFLITYMPCHFYRAFYYSSIYFDNFTGKIISEFGSSYDLIDIMPIPHVFLSINSCLNPVALCCTSRAFRSHFKRYLTCCCNTKSTKCTTSTTSTKSTKSTPIDFELTKRI